MFLFLSLSLFCQLFHGSVAMDREDLGMVSALLEEYSIDNFHLLDMYLAGEIFVERYTDAQLNDEKIKETVLKNVFPAYSNNNESQAVESEQCKNAVQELNGPHVETFEIYFNAYLLKVDEAWKIRKIDGDQVSYENVDGHNIMDLVEFLYALTSLGQNEGNYDVKKLLALIQVKHQIEEDVEKEERYMMSFERQFLDEHGLGSDLIRNASRAIYSYFRLPSGPHHYGVDGEMMYGNFSTFGNVTYGWLLERHLVADTCIGGLKLLPALRGVYKDRIKNEIEKRSDEQHEEPQHAFGHIEDHNTMGKLNLKCKNC